MYGRGHNLAVEWQDQQARLQRGVDKLTEIRGIAAKIGKTEAVEAHIQSLGGEPNFERYAAGQQALQSGALAHVETAYDAASGAWGVRAGGELVSGTFMYPTEGEALNRARADFPDAIVIWTTRDSRHSQHHAEPPVQPKSGGVVRLFHCADPGLFRTPADLDKSSFRQVVEMDLDAVAHLRKQDDGVLLEHIYEKTQNIHSAWAAQAPDYMRVGEGDNGRHRSTDVGDVISIDGQLHFCAPVGWEKIEAQEADLVRFDSPGEAFVFLQASAGDAVPTLYDRLLPHQHAARRDAVWLAVPLSDVTLDRLHHSRSPHGQSVCGGKAVVISAPMIAALEKADMRATKEPFDDHRKLADLRSARRLPSDVPDPWFITDGATKEMSNLINRAMAGRGPKLSAVSDLGVSIEIKLRRTECGVIFEGNLPSTDPAHAVRVESMPMNFLDQIELARLCNSVRATSKAVDLQQAEEAYPVPGY